MELENLSTTARALSHFTNTFERLHDVRYEIRIYFLGDQIQKTETEICGIFQLYFFRNCLHHLLKVWEKKWKFNKKHYSKSIKQNIRNR